MQTAPTLDKLKKYGAIHVRLRVELSCICAYFHQNYAVSSKVLMDKTQFFRGAAALKRVKVKLFHSDDCFSDSVIKRPWKIRSPSHKSSSDHHYMVVQRGVVSF